MTSDGQIINDFFTLFDEGKPDILFSEVLMALGEWQDYGSKLYRLNTTYSIKEVKAALICELEITAKEILVTTLISGHYHQPS